MRTLGLAVALLACAVLVLAVASSAVGATISYFGTDTATQADWRSTSVTKANDLSGDNAYGSDGWMRAQKSGGNWPDPPGVLANPTYATLAFDPHVVQTEGEAGVYMDIDQPLAPAATVVDCKAVVGYLWNHPDGDMATITLTAGKSFRLSILTNARTDAANYGNTGYGIKGPGGIDVLHSYAKAQQRNWTQFDITGAFGDVFTIYSTTIGSEHDLSVIALDSIPSVPVASASSSNWHNSGTWTPVGVPTAASAVTVGTHAVAIDTTIVSTPADCYSLTLSSSGSVSVTGQTLNVAGQDVGALNTTGGTLTLDATSILNVSKVATSTGLVNLTATAGATINVASQLKVDSSYTLTPGVSYALAPAASLDLVSGGTLTSAAGVTVPTVNANGGASAVGGAGLAATTMNVQSGGFTMGATPVTATGALTIDTGTLTAAATGGGVGALTTSGATVELKNAGTFALGQDISAATLTVTSGTATGVGSITATNPYDVRKGTVGVVLKGAGVALNKTTADTVILSKANLYTGATTISGGRLQVDGSIDAGSAVAVNAGGTLAGIGTVGGAVTVASGGKVSPGASVGTLTVAGLTLSSGSLMDFEFNSITPANDQIMVSGSGALTINGGVVSLYNEGGTTTFSTAGTYNLIGYLGSIGGAVGNLSVQNKVAGKKYTFGTTVANDFVTLAIGQGAYWNGAGGDVVWSNSANWSGASPSTGDVLPFGTAGGGGATLNNDIASGSFASLQFESGAPPFTLNGNSVTLTGDLGSNVVLNNSTNIQTVNLPITLTGAANLNAASGPIVIDSGSTITNAGFDLTIKGPNAVTLNGAISGGGGVIRSTDAGALNINSATALGTGTFRINGGTIDNTSSGGAVTLSTVTPQTWAGSFTFTGTNDLNLGTGAVTVDGNLITRTVTVNAKTLTVGGAITGTGARLYKAGTGTLVISSAGSSLDRLRVTGGTLRLDNSVAGSPTMTVTGESPMVQNDNSLLDINNATLTTAGINIQKGQVVVRGTSVINNTGGARIAESGDSNAKSYYFKDTAIINGGTGNLETSWTQAAQSTYIMMQNSAQATFANVILGPNAEYADSTGHNTVLEVKDTAQLTANNEMYVMKTNRDAGRSQIMRVHMQVYQHGGTVTVGSNLRIHDNDSVKSAASPVHQTDGAYNLSGGNLNVGGRITGGQTRVGVGQSYFNFHGGTLTYTGAGPQTDWINLTASAITDGIDSTQNLRLWEGGTIDTGTQNVTINQAILAPTGQGVSAIATTGLTGTVYNNGCPPWVFIARGAGDTTGSGASAVPTLNAAGNITGFTITNPGNNYTVKPLITLIRGDLGTPGTVPAGNITLSDNSSYTGGLTKQGTGILTLTGANTYTGDTTVTEGTLSVSTAFFGDLSTINIASGGILNLNHASMDTILYLYLAGNQQSSGIYSLALGNASPYLSGGGSLNVTMPEPATLALMALGGLGLILARKRK